MDMGNRRGISKIGVVVTVLCLAFLVGVVWPVLIFLRDGAELLVCGTNIKNIQVGMNHYSFDYDDNYPVVGGDGPWSRELGWAYNKQDVDFSPGGKEEHAGRTITASMYLLVRLEYVVPRDFRCPATNQTVFNDTSGIGLVNLWDFGSNPYKHVSYSMYNPYGKYIRKITSPAFTAIVADMSPWFKDGDIVLPASGKESPQLIDRDVYAYESHRLGNSQNHKGKRQNILYADGYMYLGKRPNVSTDSDNIYTLWSTDTEPTREDKEVGVNPTARDEANDSRHENDSFLAI